MEVSSDHHHHPDSDNRGVVVKERYVGKNMLMLFIIFSSNLFTFLVATSIYSSCSLTSPILLAHLNNQDGEVDDITNDNDPIPISHSSTNNNDDLAAEYIAFTSPQLLPFGFSSNFDSDTIYPSAGSGCTQTQLLDDLRKYMTYPVNGSCPDDELLAQKLLLGGCEPLPRRRCHPAAPTHYVQPYPLPTSLWSTPSDASVVWTAYTCKNYDCLINRKHRQKEFDDCKDCFDLEGREKTRWTATSSSGTRSHSLDFSIDEVLLSTDKPGTIRIGLDIGGGVATFAVRMRERNITIVTTSMNFNGPFNSFIASRGVVPLYISISQRLPFFDNTLDIIHSMHVLSNWIPTSLLHFFLFDIYRVLRPGGLFWLDHFFCSGDQLERIYAPLIESVGFNKLKWVVGRKLDRGPHLQEMYLSALLQKPLNNSWS